MLFSLYAFTQKWLVIAVGNTNGGPKDQYNLAQGIVILALWADCSTACGG